MESLLKSITKPADKVHMIRYADDFVITGSSKEQLENIIKPAVTVFLWERGLTLSEEKTSIVSISQGVDFLGFNVRKYGRKLLIKPARSSIKSFLDVIRKEIKTGIALPTVALIRLLKWGSQYPVVLQSWRKKWTNLSGYFRYPETIRKVIYTTNAIESVHR